MFVLQFRVAVLMEGNGVVVLSGSRFAAGDVDASDVDKLSGDD